MTANPVDLIGGITSTANVPKADFTAWAKARLPQVMASFTELRSTTLVSQLVVTFKTTGGFWFQDTADTTTADDGVTCVVSGDGFRYKPLSVIPLPAPASLGGVFSHAAVSHFFVTGINTDGTLFTAQPALADLSDAATVATLTGAQALTNKTYNGNTWTAGTGTLTLAAGTTLTGPASSGTAMTLGNVETVTGAKTFNDAKLILAGVTSGTTTLKSGGTAGSSVITLPVATDTLVGKATTDILTNKTFDTAGTGNSFSINGVAATANTGTGAVARAAGPTFTTPALGAATATTLNGNTFTTGTYTLTGVAGKTFTFSNTLTLSGTDSGTLAIGVGGTLTGSSSAAIWYDNIPQNSKSAAYTTVLADAQKHILHPSADTTARTFTIDSNANVAYPIGTAITFVNQNAGGLITIAITSDTMRLAGAGTTGSRSLAANGIATALKITSTEWIISGTNLT